MKFSNGFPFKWLSPLSKRSNFIQLFIQTIKDSFIMNMSCTFEKSNSFFFLDLVFLNLFKLKRI